MTSPTTPTTPAATARIRWHAPAESTVVAEFGYVGTLTACCLFQILKPLKDATPGQRFGEWALTATFPGAEREVRYAYSLDAPQAATELKAQAEHWLEEFVASLGATFEPEPATARKSRAWAADWAEVDRDQDGNAILRHKPTGGRYKILPVEEC